MKRLMALLFFCALPVIAGDNSVSGEWKIEGSVVGNPVNLTCTFKQDGPTLTGPCIGEDGKSLEVNGEVKDKAVTWNVETEWNGNDLTIIFSGTLESDTKMTGSIEVKPMEVSGEFTAAKKS